MSRYVAPLLLVVCLASSANAQSAGDMVLVIRGTDVTLDNKVVGRATEGDYGKVDAVDGESLLVRLNQSEQWRVKGYVNRQYVIPMEGATDFVNEVLQKAPVCWAYVIRGDLWIDRGENDIAINDYDEAIKLDPRNSRAWGGRGSAWANKKDYDRAVEDFSESIRLSPQDSHTVSQRGLAWHKKQQYDRAIADYNEALRLEPARPRYIYYRALVRQDQQDYEQAIDDFDEVIKLSPGSWIGRQSLAWLLATCPDAKYRDGQMAIEHAFVACELTRWSDAACVGTFVTAYAEANGFRSEVESMLPRACRYRALPRPVVALTLLVESLHREEHLGRRTFGIGGTLACVPRDMLDLANLAPVQKELSMSKRQVVKAAILLANFRRKAAQIVEPAFEQLKIDKAHGLSEEEQASLSDSVTRLADEYRNKLDGFLSEAQMKRLREICGQTHGHFVVENTIFGDPIALTDAQKTEMKEVHRLFDRRAEQPRLVLHGADPTDDPVKWARSLKRIQQLEDTRDDELARILTQEQRDQVRARRGKNFDVSNLPDHE